MASAAAPARGSKAYLASEQDRWARKARGEDVFHSTLSSSHEPGVDQAVWTSTVGPDGDEVTPEGLVAEARREKLRREREEAERRQREHAELAAESNGLLKAAAAAAPAEKQGAAPSPSAVVKSASSASSASSGAGAAGGRKLGGLLKNAVNRALSAKKLREGGQESARRREKEKRKHERRMSRRRRAAGRRRFNSVGDEDSDEEVENTAGKLTVRVLKGENMPVEANIGSGFTFAIVSFGNRKKVSRPAKVAVGRTEIDDASNQTRVLYDHTWNQKVGPFRVADASVEKIKIEVVHERRSGKTVKAQVNCGVAALRIGRRYRDPANPQRWAREYVAYTQTVSVPLQSKAARAFGDVPGSKGEPARSVTLQVTYEPDRDDDDAAAGGGARGGARARAGRDDDDGSSSSGAGRSSAATSDVTSDSSDSSSDSDRGVAGGGAVAAQARRLRADGKPLTAEEIAQRDHDKKVVEEARHQAMLAAVKAEQAHELAERQAAKRERGQLSDPSDDEYNDLVDTAHEATYALEELRDQGALEKYGGTLYIHLLRGADLLNCDFLSLSDPYCVFTLTNDFYKRQSSKSRVIDDDLNPEWNEELDPLEVTDAYNQSLLCECYDEDVGADDFMGRFEIRLDDPRFNVLSEQETELTLPLLDGQGTITVRLQFKRPESAVTLKGYASALSQLSLHRQKSEGRVDPGAVRRHASGMLSDEDDDDGSGSDRERKISPDEGLLTLELKKGLQLPAFRGDRAGFVVVRAERFKKEFALKTTKKGAVKAIDFGELKVWRFPTARLHLEFLSGGGGGDDDGGEERSPAGTVSVKLAHNALNLASGVPKKATLALKSEKFKNATVTLVMSYVSRRELEEAAGGKKKKKKKDKKKDKKKKKKKDKKNRDRGRRGGDSGDDSESAGDGPPPLVDEPAREDASADSIDALAAALAEAEPDDDGPPALAPKAAKSPRASREGSDGRLRVTVVRAESVDDDESAPARCVVSLTKGGEPTTTPATSGGGGGGWDWNARVPSIPVNKFAKQKLRLAVQTLQHDAASGLDMPRAESVVEFRISSSKVGLDSGEAREMRLGLKPRGKISVVLQYLPAGSPPSDDEDERDGADNDGDEEKENLRSLEEAEREASLELLNELARVDDGLAPVAESAAEEEEMDDEDDGAPPPLVGAGAAGNANDDEDDDDEDQQRLEGALTVTITKISKIVNADGKSLHKEGAGNNNIQVLVEAGKGSDGGVRAFTAPVRLRKKAVRFKEACVVPVRGGVKDGLVTVTAATVDEDGRVETVLGRSTYTATEKQLKALRSGKKLELGGAPMVLGYDASNEVDGPTVIFEVTLRAGGDAFAEAERACRMAETDRELAAQEAEQDRKERARESARAKAAEEKKGGDGGDDDEQDDDGPPPLAAAGAAGAAAPADSDSDAGPPPLVGQQQQQQQPQEDEDVAALYDEAGGADAVSGAVSVLVTKLGRMTAADGTPINQTDERHVVLRCAVGDTVTQTPVVELLRKAIRWKDPLVLPVNNLDADTVVMSVVRVDAAGRELSVIGKHDVPLGDDFTGPVLLRGEVVAVDGERMDRADGANAKGPSVGYEVSFDRGAAAAEDAADACDRQARKLADRLAAAAAAPGEAGEDDYKRPDEADAHGGTGGTGGTGGGGTGGGGTADGADGDAEALGDAEFDAMLAAEAEREGAADQEEEEAGDDASRSGLLGVEVFDAGELPPGTTFLELSVGDGGDPVVSDAVKHSGFAKFNARLTGVAVDDWDAQRLVVRVLNRRRLRKPELVASGSAALGDLADGRAKRVSVPLAFEDGFDGDDEAAVSLSLRITGANAGNNAAGDDENDGDDGPREARPSVW